MLEHPVVKAHSPHVILISPPPINEFACEENDRAKGYLEPRRNASHTKMYAEAAKEISEEHHVVLLDLFSLFMRHAGYEERSTVLPGSKQLPPNPILRMLVHDGV